jgi:hypothetical protein
MDMHATLAPTVQPHERAQYNTAHAQCNRGAQCAAVLLVKPLFPIISHKFIITLWLIIGKSGFTKSPGFMGCDSSRGLGDPRAGHRVTKGFGIKILVRVGGVEKHRFARRRPLGFLF